MNVCICVSLCSINFEQEEREEGRGGRKGREAGREGVAISLLGLIRVNKVVRPESQIKTTRPRTLVCLLHFLPLSVYLGLPPSCTHHVHAPAEDEPALAQPQAEEGDGADQQDTRKPPQDRKEQGGGGHVLL